MEEDSYDAIAALKCEKKARIDTIFLQKNGVWFG